MHANAGDIKDPGLIPGFERFPGERNGNPLQDSCLENPHGQRMLAGYSPWGRTELDTTEATQQQQQHTTPRLSLVAQMVKNSPAMRETWVLSLG